MKYFKIDRQFDTIFNVTQKVSVLCYERITERKYNFTSLHALNCPHCVAIQYRGRLCYIYPLLSPNIIALSIGDNCENSICMRLECVFFVCFLRPSQHFSGHVGTGVYVPWL